MVGGEANFATYDETTCDGHGIYILPTRKQNMAQYHPLPTRQYCQQHSHPSFSWGQDLPPHPEPSIVSTTPTQPISQRPLQQLAQPSSRVLTCMTDITARNNHRLLLTVREFALPRRFTGSLRFEASMSDEIVRYNHSRALETTWLFFWGKEKVWNIQKSQWETCLEFSGNVVEVNYCS